MSEFQPRFMAASFAQDSRFSRGISPGNSEHPAPAPPPLMQEMQPDPVSLALEQGYEAGLAEARAEAEAAATQAEAARARFALSFAKLDAELTEALRQKLHATVGALCEETLRPLALDQGALARRTERAVAMFARADDDRVIRLHPEDLALVAPQLPAEWTFLADPALERGALRVETLSGGVEDGPEQWRRDITEALRLC